MKTGRIGRRAVMALGIAITITSVTAMPLRAGRSKLAYRSLTPAHAVESSWRHIVKDPICSVAWSPDGRYIAFTTVHNADIWSSDIYIPVGKRAAAVWTVKADSVDTKPVLRRIAELRGTSYVPVFPFWISSTEIAWGTVEKQGSDDLNFKFLRASILHDGVSQLGGRKFKLFQRIHTYGPQDVYWDRQHRWVAFSASEKIPVGGYFGRSRIYIYDPSREKLDAVDMPPSPTDSNGKRVEEAVYFSGSPRSEGKRFAWTWCLPNGNVFETRGMGTRGSSTVSLASAKVIGQGKYLTFPRLSPKGDKIAWIEKYTPPGTVKSGDPFVNDMLLQDRVRVTRLATGKSAVICSLKYANLSSLPHRFLDCPYSWSPDGKSVAYTDGSRILIAHL